MKAMRVGLLRDRSRGPRDEAHGGISRTTSGLHLVSRKMFFFGHAGLDPVIRSLMNGFLMFMCEIS